MVQRRQLGLLVLWQLSLARALSSSASGGSTGSALKKYMDQTTGGGTLNFCQNCAAPLVRRVPDGDERERACCDTCGFIAYQNPKVVAGVVVEAADGAGVVLGRRAIEPCYGKWGFPQGYMENGETTREAAARECLEETGCVVDAAALRLLAVLNIPNQVQLVYGGRATGAPAASTTESLEVASFAWDDVPWDELAFPTVTWCLEHARDHVGVARGGGGGGGGGAPRPWSDDFDVLQRRKMVVDGVWTVTDES